MDNYHKKMKKLKLRIIRYNFQTIKILTKQVKLNHLKIRYKFWKLKNDWYLQMIIYFILLKYF